jgi:hypothetical protein
MCGVEAELEEDDEVFDNRPKRAEKPRESPEKIIPVLRVYEEAETVGCVSGEREKEEE